MTTGGSVAVGVLVTATGGAVATTGGSSRVSSGCAYSCATQIPPTTMPETAVASARINANEPPPLLHPSMADLYRSKVEELASALQREETRLEASEMLRGLIDSIVLTPEGGQLRIELRGNLAAMLTAAQQTKRSPESGDLIVPVQVVAGARNRRYLQLWSGAA